MKLFKLSKFLFIFLIITKIGYSQSVVTSNAFIEACYNKTECYGLSNSALIFLNNNGEFTLQMDFNNFRIGNDTLDDWLNDLSKTCFLFKGTVNPSEFSGVVNNNSKPSIVNGYINFNGIIKPYNLEVNFLRNSQEGNLISNNAQNYFDRVAISSMQIVFHARDFHIGNRSHHYKKTIRIAIARGYINEGTSETDLFIKH